MFPYHFEFVHLIEFISITMLKWLFLALFWLKKQMIY